MMIFWPGYFLFQALRQGNAAVLPFHTDIHEDDVGPDFLTGWFDEFRKRQGTDDFDVPLASKIFFSPSSRIFWSSTIISRIMVIPHFYSNDEVRLCRQRQAAA